MTLTTDKIKSAAAVDDFKSLAVLPLEAFDILSKQMVASDNDELQVAGMMLAELIERTRQYYSGLFAAVAVENKKSEAAKCDLSDDLG